MLEWLKEILGEGYTEDIDKAVSGKIGENFVSKADFNKKVEDLKSKDGQIKDLNGQIKDRDKQLDELKKVDPDKLKDEIESLKEANKSTQEAYDAKIAQMVLDSAVDAAVGASGAKDSISVRAHLADFLKDAKVGEDGKVVGLGEKLEALKTAEGTSFLFGKSGPNLSGAVPQDPAAGGTPQPGKKPEEMTYEDFVAAESNVE